MNSPDREDVLAREPLDQVDERILRALREGALTFDPVPPDLIQQVQFEMTVARLEADLAELVTVAEELVGHRAVEYERASTLSFASGSFTAMLTIDPEKTSGGRLHGWVGVGYEVELRERARTQVVGTDDSGRFAFPEVSQGLVHLIFRALDTGQTVITPVFEV